MLPWLWFNSSVSMITALCCPGYGLTPLSLW
uniref:Uncharacterized protein n=1 Tax=Anguilla anguilla TaxID=7936 RepID=A0A0E9W3S5_ANGAN